MANNGFLAAQKARIDRERADAANQASDLMKWMCLVATKRTRGLSSKGADAWFKNLQEIHGAFMAEASEYRDLAIERLRRECEEITGEKVERVD